MRIPTLLSLTAAMGLLAACNMKKLTVNQTANVLEAAQPAMQMESDPELAKAAAPASLKTVEGFLLSSPDNEQLIRLLARGYCEYAFGFLENDYEALMAEGEFEKADALGQRITKLYLRCMNYGMRLLGKGWEEAIQGELDAFEARVKKVGKDKIDGLFLTALGLASAINMNRDDISMVAYLPKAKMMFERVLELDETYYNGGAHMALGKLYTSRAAALGGDPEKGKEHFEKAIAIPGGKYLMPKVLMAQAYGTITQNRKFFHDTLVEVLKTSPAIWPEQRLANELAHIRAKRYLAQESDWF